MCCESSFINHFQERGEGQIDLLLVPYDLLTEKEKKKNRERCQELLKYILYQGYNLYREGREENGERYAIRNGRLK